MARKSSTIASRPSQVPEIGRSPASKVQVASSANASRIAATSPALHGRDVAPQHQPCCRWIDS